MRLWSYPSKEQWDAFPEGVKMQMIETALAMICEPIEERSVFIQGKGIPKKKPPCDSAIFRNQRGSFYFWTEREGVKKWVRFL